MATITVVGAGVMGTALTFPAADNGHTIHLVGTHLDEDIIKSCKAERIHPRLKRRIPDGIQPYFHTEVGEAMKGADVIVIGVNSRGVHWAAETIGPHLEPGQIILMVTKGLEKDPDTDGLKVLPDVLASELPAEIRDQVEYAAIGGPSIAGELAARRPTSVVFVSRNGEILPRLRELFSTPYYHIWTSTDMIGVEVCVALKNPYALAVGLATGLLEKNPDDEAGAAMHNYAAAVFAQGLAETAILVELMGGGRETVFSLPGAGDLYVTTQGGRNSRMGRLLGLGMAYSDAIEEMANETIEGADAIVEITPTIEKLIEMGKIPEGSMPLLKTLYQVVTKHEPIEMDFRSFFSWLPFAPPPSLTGNTE